MDMKRLTVEEVHEQKVAELGLDPDALDLSSVEAIAGALRRVASLLCPCTRASLVRAVVRPLRGLLDDTGEIKELVDETLEAVIAHGDIFEHEAVAEDHSLGNGALLYAAPPSFISRQSGSTILLGVVSDQLSALPDELEARIDYVNHIRRLNALPDEDLRNDLMQLGLIELSYDEWLRSPPVETAAAHLSALNALLDTAQPSHDIPGLSLLDPERPVTYYRGRWTDPRSHTGRYVGRRKQSYGADLWCYVQLDNGHPERLVDLPIAGSRWRGCDEAWRLQQAIDASRGQPQQFRIRPLRGGMVALDIFSPLPMWARRRWDAVGEPVPASACLFAYRLADGELKEEMDFAQDTLWLTELRPE